MWNKIMFTLTFCLFCSPVLGNEPPELKKEILTPPIEDLWLTSSTGKKLYSKTKADSYGWPTWRISQWSIPKDLPEFKNTAKDIWVTRNNHAIVLYNYNYNAVTLETNGSELSCNGPTEFDLLLSPVTSTESKPLEEIAELTINFDINLKESLILNNRCKINKGGNFIAVTLANRSENKVFYYQLQIEATWDSNQEFWWREGEEVDGKIRYGFRGQLFTFGLDKPTYGKFNFYTIDLIDELILLLEEQGEDPAKWAYSGMYAGSYIWGSAYTHAIWRKIKIEISY